MGIKELMEKVYQEPEKVPWNLPDASPEVIDLVESEKIKPCKVIDIGCGFGRNSIYLASKGFDVTGIDVSGRAIELAQEKARRAGVECKFSPLDVSDLGQLSEKFDFVLEFGLLHMMEREKKENHMKNITNVLGSRGNYLSVCFNIQSDGFGNPGERVRTGSTGSTLRFYSLDELTDLYSPHFRIIESRVIELINEKDGQIHKVNYFFMEKIK